MDTEKKLFSKYADKTIFRKKSTILRFSTKSRGFYITRIKFAYKNKNLVFNRSIHENKDW